MPPQTKRISHRIPMPSSALLFLLVAHLAVGEPTTLAATPSTLTKSDHAITLRWSNLPDPSPLDYSPPSSADLDYLGFLLLNSSASWATGADSLTLPRLPDLRAPYQLRLFRGLPPPVERSKGPLVDQDGDPAAPQRRHPRRRLRQCGLRGIWRGARSARASIFFLC